MTEYGRPPGGHAIHEAPSIGELEVHAFGSGDQVARFPTGQRGVRVPDVLAVKPEPLFQVG